MTYEWRLHEKTRESCLCGRQRRAKPPQIFGSAAPIKRRVPFVRSQARKTVSASSRRVGAPANTQQGPEGPGKAKSQRSQAYA